MVSTLLKPSLVMSWVPWAILWHLKSVRRVGERFLGLAQHVISEA